MVFSNTDLFLIAVIIPLVVWGFMKIENERINALKEKTKEDEEEIKEDEGEEKETWEYQRMTGCGREYDMIEALKELFEQKEELVMELLSKMFNSEEMSYDKFKIHIDKCHKMFFEEYKNALLVLTYSTRSDYKKIAFEGHFKNCEAIVEKIDDLINEIIENETRTCDGDLKNLLDDMDVLNNSVDDY